LLRILYDCRGKYVLICDNRYDKNFKTRIYIQNININAVFVSLKFLFYIKNTVPNDFGYPRPRAQYALSSKEMTTIEDYGD